MSITTTMNARFLAAIAAGLAGCHETQSTTIDVAPVPSPAQSQSATGAASAPPTQSVEAVASVTPAPPASSSATRPRPSLKCPDNAKLVRQCVAPNTQPETGGNVAMPAPYTGFDQNGCYAAQAIQTACNGIAVARGPFFASGRCCFDVCQGMAAPCGRPLLVDGRARLAPTVSRAGWSLSRLDLPGAAPDVRARAARAWREDAAVEHASVAAFARLSLQLLSLGAPSDLVAASHAAALQEIHHARICFTIAAALGDEPPLGPAPLAIDGIALHATLASVAREAAVESCIGETVSALVLTRAAESSGSDVLCAHLVRMAEEEAEHAALGWKLVAWACRVGGAAVRSAVGEALVVREFDAVAMHADDAADWRRLGRITREDMTAVLRDATVVVGEARDALFA